MGDLSHTTYMDALDMRQAAEERADHFMMQADTDSLTGLLNLRGLERRTRARDWGWYVAVDLDDFKAAQDAHERGHAYGDGILEEWSDWITANTRQGRDMRARDILVARTGGDEFTLWCETRVGATRIRDAVREWRSDDGLVSASAGLGQDRENADAACYINKQDRKESTS